MEIIKGLEWRYATKKFDADKKLPETELNALKRAVQLSASSYGLQPYKVLIVTDPSVREQLLPASWNQPQIIEASHLFIFCSRLHTGATEVATFFDRKAKVQGMEASVFEGAVSFVSGKIAEKSESDIKVWNTHQTYIAVGTLLAAAGEAQVDACPMEGFDPKAYDTILGLTEQGLQASVVVALGYRALEDDNAKAPKVRKSEADLFTIV